MQPSLTIQAIIRQQLERHFTGVSSLQFQSIGGGSINETYRLTFANHVLFCKINSASGFPHLFKKESNGLQLLGEQAIIKTPGVIDCFETEDVQVLLLEWIYPGERTEGFWKKFGEQLAALHAVSSDCFGLYEDNYMGSVPQGNQLSAGWADFFTGQRLEPLIKVCTGKKLLGKEHLQQFDKLYRLLPSIFDNGQRPSLVHGDLWSGNFLCNQASEPVLIDPAVYYGLPSVDLGMSTLFGGFSAAFYEAYQYHAPFPENYEKQWQVSNLYPLLLHLYLFGPGYLSQIEQTLDRF